jgi:hypothetical protein
MGAIPFANEAVTKIGASSSRGLDAIRDLVAFQFEDYFYQIAACHCPVGRSNTPGYEPVHAL